MCRTTVNRVIIRLRYILQTVLVLVLIVLTATWALGYFHYGYRLVALRLALRGFPYQNTFDAQEFLQSIGPSLFHPTDDERIRVLKLITWLQTNMPLQSGLPNHPNTVYLIQAGGVCGQFADVLVDLLRANNLEARQVLLNWTHEGAAHVIVEVKTGGQWVAFDPLEFGAFAFQEGARVSHIQNQGHGLSTLELYQHPELLPKENAYGEKFFASGRQFKVEVRQDYLHYDAKPKFIYGRDWPLVDARQPEQALWFYSDMRDSGLRQIAVSQVFPYFSRVTIWFGVIPVVLHFEWAPLLIVLVTIGAMSVAGQLARRFHRCRSFIQSMVLLSGVIILGIYFLVMIITWQQRYIL